MMFSAHTVQGGHQQEGEEHAGQTFELVCWGTFRSALLWQTAADRLGVGDKGLPVQQKQICVFFPARTAGRVCCGL